MQTRRIQNTVRRATPNEASVSRLSRRKQNLIMISSAAALTICHATQYCRNCRVCRRSSVVRSFKPHKWVLGDNKYIAIPSI